LYFIFTTGTNIIILSVSYYQAGLNSVIGFFTPFLVAMKQGIVMFFYIMAEFDFICIITKSVSIDTGTGRVPKSTISPSQRL